MSDMPDPEQSTLDPRPILAALGLAVPDAIRSVRGGSGTSLWRVERAGETFALRVFRPGQQDVAERETLAMRAASAAGLPVPVIRAAGAWRERPALLLSWCPGSTLSAALAARPWGAYALGVAFGRMQARIHAVAPPPEFPQQPAAWIDWAGATTPDLAGQLGSLTSRPALLHLDYHPLNVLTVGGRITAVLDWANARAGDPRADLARTVTLLRLSPVEPGAPAPLVRLVLRMLEAGWRRGYRRAGGSQRSLAPFYAWAGELMERDLAPKAERVGLTATDMARIRRWTAHWHRYGQRCEGAHSDESA